MEEEKQWRWEWKGKLTLKLPWVSSVFVWAYFSKISLSNVGSVVSQRSWDWGVWWSRQVSCVVPPRQGSGFKESTRSLRLSYYCYWSFLRIKIFSENENGTTLITKRGPMETELNPWCDLFPIALRNVGGSTALDAAFRQHLTFVIITRLLDFFLPPIWFYDIFNKLIWCVLFLIFINL